MKTKYEFKQATGFDPLQDDMERVNCIKAGELGHECCGWNDKTNLPVFISPNKIEIGEFLGELDEKR